MILGVRDPSRQAGRAAFWLLLVLALAVGGSHALSGFPALVQSLVPSGMMAAQAEHLGAAPVAHARLDEGFPASRYSPQWLTPVAAHAYPAWLSMRLQAGGTGGAPPLADRDPRPVIAIVIDDLGDDAAAARKAIALPAAVSLSFLPYPEGTPTLARAAAHAGHEVLAHVPMEPDGADDPGPNALLTSLSAAENAQRLEWDLSRVPGHSGINNHEGSRFTADRVALMPVMEALSDRRLFFLDSRTSPNTQVVPLARAFGVPSAGRDVFLDDIQTPQAIAAALSEAERVSRRDGVAIAIGHPRQATLAALAAWCAHRGDLVAISVAIRIKTEHEIRALSAR
ncbi:MAG: divergent polysaccharide deacetylase family protein [Rhizomicrobium sp.]